MSDLEPECSFETLRAERVVPEPDRGEETFTITMQIQAK